MEWKLFADLAEVGGDRVVVDLGEPEDGTAGLDGVDDLRGVVAGEDEPRVVRELLHRAAERGLGVVGERVGLVEEDDAVVVAAEGGPREVLDAVPDHVDAALVAGVQLEEVLLPVVAVYLLGDRDGGCGLPGAGGAREQQVREVVPVDVALEALRDVGVADDVLESLRPVLLDPDFLPSAGGVCHVVCVALPGLKLRETGGGHADERSKAAV